MESRAKLAGHPIHPMLVVFPLGLLATSFIFDLVALVGDRPFFAEMAFWLISVGIIGGLVAAAFGLYDFVFIPKGTRARRIGAWHGLGNLVVVLLFAGSWLLRLRDASHPSSGALLLSFTAIIIAAISGWLGGELVDRLGIGVDEGAHPDAPSSLKTRTLKRPLEV
jgi:uncharacterized membrane protein